jgi:hypothetical protein
MANDDIQAIGAVNLQARTRTNASGATKTRYTMEVSGDSILVNTDPKTLGKGPAEAIAAVLRERISSVSAVVSPATMRAREVAAKALAEGKAWAVKRYGGGRIGTMAPNQSDRMFSDSGRFAKSVAVGATSDGYTINVAANRLDPNTLNGGEAALAKIFELLKQHVPEIADARKLLDSIPVRRAIQDGLRAAVKKVDERRLELEKQKMSAAINLAKTVLGLVA